MASAPFCALRERARVRAAGAALQIRRAASGGARRPTPTRRKTCNTGRPEGGRGEPMARARWGRAGAVDACATAARGPTRACAQMGARETAAPPRPGRSSPSPRHQLGGTSAAGSGVEASRESRRIATDSMDLKSGISSSLAARRDAHPAASAACTKRPTSPVRSFSAITTSVSGPASTARSPSRVASAGGLASFDSTQRRPALPG
mmetsp:Transcript_70948/g.219043  ORF Transcript_70948/g.219043 Transcript_70948/m.219043 type:complete len:206 (-) Transcript_70948:276-893(-)